MAYATTTAYVDTALLLRPLHASLTQPDVKLERERAQESEAAWRGQREELQQRLEALQLEHAEALVRQREEAAAHVRSLQVRYGRM